MPKFMRKINIISRAASVYRSDKLESDILSGCHTSYIFAICRNPGITQDELVRHICTNKSTVARHLAYLEKHGYIERRVDKSDRRALNVFPTDKMLEVLPRIREIISAWNEYLVEGLDENDMAVFVGVLDKLADRASAYIGEKVAEE